MNGYQNEKKIMKLILNKKKNMYVTNYRWMQINWNKINKIILKKLLGSACSGSRNLVISW